MKKNEPCEDGEQLEGLLWVARDILSQVAMVEKNLNVI
jgi:hypothetical protein